ncbi:MAG: SIMPL domain-containing protein [Colwelliaceae bacterium]|nr:SIMPL domain-containing protein [Colwelliaceae bacterium]
MVRIFVSLVSLCLLSISLSSYSNGIEVTGKASVMTIPDTFSLTITIKERGKSSSKTKALVDYKSSKVVKMFVKQGINANAIDTSQVRMFPIYEKPPISFENIELQNKISKQQKITLSGNADKQENESHLTRFEISRTIAISFKELSLYDTVLDNVVKLGVSHISPIEVSMSDSEKYYQQALYMAIEKAQNKAANIARQAGVKLGTLLSLKESGYHSPMRYSMASEARSDFSSKITKKAISAQVTAIYSIEP